MEHTVVSQLSFRLPLRYSGFFHPQNRYISAQQLFENIRGSSALAEHQRLKLVFICGQVVCQLLYTTWSVVIQIWPEMLLLLRPYRTTVSVRVINRPLARRLCVFQRILSIGFGRKSRYCCYFCQKFLFYVVLKTFYSVMEC